MTFSPRRGQRALDSPSTTALLSPLRSPSSSSSGSSHIHAFHAGPPSASSPRSPYYSSAKSTSSLPSLSDKFSLSPDPAAWGAILSPNYPEPDDYLHNPDPKRDYHIDTSKNILTYRGLTNLGCLIILGLGFVALFAGYPLISFFTSHPPSTLGGFNFGGINASGQVPSMNGNWGLIDLETDHKLYTIPSYFNPKQEMQLVFSDEFNTDGRTFYPGDDPYWEAADLHYWQTNNLEWYDPSAITTKGGALQVTLSAVKNHDLNHMGGMITTWNKFCFTGGLILTSVTLPGINNVMGLWPAIWAMGNLGRAGYGASLEGMWPYTYDACDVGTAPNQTVNGMPLAATVNGDPNNGDALSYLQGQRLSRCTCPGESHPGPVHEDGTYVGRAAPEIDVFEAQVTNNAGQVSQSSQWAPFNHQLKWLNTSQNLIIADPDTTHLNLFYGNAYQQTTSSVTDTDPDCYQLTKGCFSVYGFEYKPGYGDAYISWISDNKLAWTVMASGMVADNIVEISDRPVPQEPMYLIVNLGMSRNFGPVDLEHLTFPAIMSVDWIRVYQPEGQVNIGCDPKEYPTAAYIDEYIEAYTNPNLTTWTDDFKQPFPRNKFVEGGC